MQFTSAYTLPIDCHPRPLTDEEKYDLVVWLESEYFYELEAGDSVERKERVLEGLDSSYIAVFERGRDGSSDKFVVVINSGGVHMYTFAQNGEFVDEGTYEQT